MKPHVRTILVMRRERRLAALEELDRCHVEVTPACDWDEAARILAKTEVDVVLTDTDGDWRSVRDSAGRRIQIVVCARRGGERLCAEFFRRGAYDVLVEPYSGEELRRVLEAAAAKTYMDSLPAATPWVAGAAG